MQIFFNVYALDKCAFWILTIFHKCVKIHCNTSLWVWVCPTVNIVQTPNLVSGLSWNDYNFPLQPVCRVFSPQELQTYETFLWNHCNMTERGTKEVAPTWAPMAPESLRQNATLPSPPLPCAECAKPLPQLQWTPSLLPNLLLLPLHSAADGCWLAGCHRVLPSFPIPCCLTYVSHETTRWGYLRIWSGMLPICEWYPAHFHFLPLAFKWNI